MSMNGAPRSAVVKTGRWASLCREMTGPKHSTSLDADMALNGTGPANWSTGLSGWNCSSLCYRPLFTNGTFRWQTIALSAIGRLWCPSHRTGSRFRRPNGLRALYPGVGGGIGYGCDSQSDCNAGYSCITFNNASFCSNLCGGDSDCPDG